MLREEISVENIVALSFVMDTSITTVVILRLKPNSTFSDPDTQPGKIKQSTLDAFSDLPGCERVSWGRDLDNRDLLMLLIGIFFQLLG